MTPLVIRLGALGDMINVSALTHYLRNRYGAPCCVIGVGPWCVPVFRGNPDVATIAPLHRRVPFALDPAGWYALAALRRDPRAPIYVCDTDRHLARVRRLLAVARVDPRRCELLAALPVVPGEHYVDSLIRLGRRTPAMLDAAHWPAPDGAGACGHLPRDLDAERIAVAAWLASRGGSGKPLVLIQPGNRRTMSSRRARHRRRGTDAKSWPEERWIELIGRVQGQIPGALILLCGAPSERAMLEQLRAAAGSSPAVCVATPPLREFFALCESAHSMISIDTGPAHAAAALGVPLVVLFGAEPQSRWLPRSPAGTPVVGLGGPPYATHAGEIAVDAVYAAWAALGADTSRVSLGALPQPRARP